MLLRSPTGVVPDRQQSSPEKMLLRYKLPLKPVARSNAANVATSTRASLKEQSAADSSSHRLTASFVAACIVIAASSILINA